MLKQCFLILRVLVCFSFSKVLEQKEQLEQKHLHLLQILDSERQAKWHYVQQTDELAAEVKKLKNEVRCFSIQHVTPTQSQCHDGSVSQPALSLHWVNVSCSLGVSLSKCYMLTTVLLFKANGSKVRLLSFNSSIISSP